MLEEVFAESAYVGQPAKIQPWNKFAVSVLDVLFCRHPSQTIATGAQSPRTYPLLPATKSSSNARVRRTRERCR